VNQAESPNTNKG